MKKLFVCLFICSNAKAVHQCAEMRDPKIDLIFNGKIISSESIKASGVTKNNKLDQFDYDYGDLQKITFEITKIIKGKHDKKEIDVYRDGHDTRGFTDLYNKEVFVAGSYRDIGNTNISKSFLTKYFIKDDMKTDKIFLMFENVCKKEEYSKYKFRYAKPEDLTNADYK